MLLPWLLIYEALSAIEVNKMSTVGYWKASQRSGYKWMLP